MDPNGLVWQRANIHDGAVHGYKEGNNDEGSQEKDNSFETKDVLALASRDILTRHGLL